MMELLTGMSNELGNAIKEEMEKAVKKFNKLCEDVRKMQVDIEIIKEDQLIENAKREEKTG